MKIIFSMMLFACMSLATAFAQVVTYPKHKISIGAGYIFVGSGDMIGGVYRNEYEYLATKRVALAASINIGSAGREIRGIQSLSYRKVKGITTFDVNANVNMIDFQRFKLKVGGGVALKRQIDNDARSVGFYINGLVSNDELMTVNYQSNMKSWSVGWVVPVAIEVHSNRLVYQVRPSLHSFLDGEINTSLTFGVGYKLK